MRTVGCIQKEICPLQIVVNHQGVSSTVGLIGGVVGPCNADVAGAAGGIDGVEVDGLLIASLGRRHLSVDDGQKVGMFHGGACSQTIIVVIAQQFVQEIKRLG